jgi:hypothetical protein
MGDFIRRRGGNPPNFLAKCLFLLYKFREKYYGNDEIR